MSFIEKWELLSSYESFSQLIRENSYLEDKQGTFFVDTVKISEKLGIPRFHIDQATKEALRPSIIRGIKIVPNETEIMLQQFIIDVLYKMVSGGSLALKVQEIMQQCVLVLDSP